MEDVVFWKGRGEFDAQIITIIIIIFSVFFDRRWQSSNTYEELRMFEGTFWGLFSEEGGEDCGRIGNKVIRLRTSSLSLLGYLYLSRSFPLCIIDTIHHIFSHLYPSKLSICLENMVVRPGIPLYHRPTFDFICSNKEVISKLGHSTNQHLHREREDESNSSISWYLSWKAVCVLKGYVEKSSLLVEEVVGFWRIWFLMSFNFCRNYRFG